MLNNKQQRLYDDFYRSTHENQVLDRQTELLVGLSAAMSMNCAPCTRYYLEKCRDAGIPRQAISEVLAKVMAVAAGQKKLQAADVIDRYQIDLSQFG